MRLPPQEAVFLVPAATASHKKSRPCGAALKTSNEVLSLNQDFALNVSALTAG